MKAQQDSKVFDFVNMKNQATFNSMSQELARLLAEGELTKVTTAAETMLKLPRLSTKVKAMLRLTLAHCDLVSCNYASAHQSFEEALQLLQSLSKQQRALDQQGTALLTIKATVGRIIIQIITYDPENTTYDVHEMLKMILDYPPPMRVTLYELACFSIFDVKRLFPSFTQVSPVDMKHPQLKQFQSILAEFQDSYQAAIQLQEEAYLFHRSKRNNVMELLSLNRLIELYKDYPQAARAVKKNGSRKRLTLNELELEFQNILERPPLQHLNVNTLFRHSRQKIDLCKKVISLMLKVEETFQQEDANPSNYCWLANLLVKQLREDEQQTKQIIKLIQAIQNKTIPMEALLNLQYTKEIKAKTASMLQKAFDTVTSSIKKVYLPILVQIYVNESQQTATKQIQISHKNKQPTQWSTHTPTRNNKNQPQQLERSTTKFSINNETNINYVPPNVTPQSNKKKQPHVAKPIQSEARKEQKGNINNGIRKEEKIHLSISPGPQISLQGTNRTAEQKYHLTASNYSLEGQQLNISHQVATQTQASKLVVQSGQQGPTLQGSLKTNRPYLKDSNDNNQQDEEYNSHPITDLKGLSPISGIRPEQKKNQHNKLKKGSLNSDKLQDYVRQFENVSPSKIVLPNSSLNMTNRFTAPPSTQSAVSPQNNSTIFDMFMVQSPVSVSMTKTGQREQVVKPKNPNSLSPIRNDQSPIRAGKKAERGVILYETNNAPHGYIEPKTSININPANEDYHKQTGNNSSNYPSQYNQSPKSGVIPNGAYRPQPSNNHPTGYNAQQDHTLSYTHLDETNNNNTIEIEDHHMSQDVKRTNSGRSNKIQFQGKPINQDNRQNSLAFQSSPSFEDRSLPYSQQANVLTSFGMASQKHNITQNGMHVKQLQENRNQQRETQNQNNKNNDKIVISNDPISHNTSTPNRTKNDRKIEKQSKISFQRGIAVNGSRLVEDDRPPQPPQQRFADKAGVPVKTLDFWSNNNNVVVKNKPSSTQSEKGYSTSNHFGSTLNLPVAHVTPTSLINPTHSQGPTTLPMEYPPRHQETSMKSSHSRPKPPKNPSVMSNAPSNINQSELRFGYYTSADHKVRLEMRKIDGALSEERMRRAQRFCQRGQFIQKRHYTSDTGQSRFFQVSPDGHEVRWSVDENKMLQGKYKSYAIKDITGLLFGKISSTFLKESNQSLEPWKCFSIIMQKRTFDVFCVQPKDVLMWLLGIGKLIRSHSKPKSKLMERQVMYSMGRYIWKRFFYRIQQKYGHKIKSKRTTFPWFLKAFLYACQQFKMQPVDRHNFPTLRKQRRNN